jgi:CysZ protein
MNPSLGVSAGIRAFFGGIGFIIGTPGVWPFAAVPVLVLLLISIGLTVLGIYGAGWLTEWIFGAEELSTWSKIGAWALKAVFWLLAILLAGLLGLMLAQPLSGFALDIIAQRQELALTGIRRPDPPRVAGMLRGLRVALLTLTVGAICFTFLFVLDLVFPLALVVTVPLKFLLVGWLLAWDFADYPLGLRAFGFRARLRWFGRNFAAVTVFGCMWSLMLVVPGVILLILPVGVAGATRLAVASERRRNSG